MALYREAPDVKRIADRLIPQHHQELSWRADEIRYLFRDDIPTSNGRVVMGKARKLGGLGCYLAWTDAEDSNTFEDHEEVGTDMFVIEVYEPCWDRLTAAGQEALVDHELCHLGWQENSKGVMRRVIRGHSVEEFNEIVRRHGLWKPDLKEFAKQLTLTRTTDEKE